MGIVKYFMIQTRDLYRSMLEKRLKRISYAQAKLDKHKYKMEYEYEEYFNTYV